MDVVCTQCGSSFTAKRSTAKYCSPTCRQRARRDRDAPGEVTETDDAPAATLSIGILLGEDIVAATKRDLESANKLDTVIGRQALVVAARMTLPKATGSEIAALSRELSRLMSLAVGKGNQEEDPVDEVKRKRDAKIAKARQTTA